jgi:hypothetical protein
VPFAWFTVDDEFGENPGCLGVPPDPGPCAVSSSSPINHAYLGLGRARWHGFSW